MSTLSIGEALLRIVSAILLSGNRWSWEPNPFPWSGELSIDLLANSDGSLPSYTELSPHKFIVIPAESPRGLPARLPSTATTVKLEVFIHNLPRDLTEDGLTTHLQPFLTKLGILDYLCEKPKKKTFGHVTFLSHSDGTRFLAVHGEETLPENSRGRPALRSRLKLMGVGVYCKLSVRQPQKFTLKSLQLTAEERKNPTRETEEEGRPTSFTLRSFSCGYCMYVGADLAYVPEVQWPDQGFLRFSRRNLVVKLGSQTLIRIPLNTVIHLVWSPRGSLNLTLSTVPIFSGNDGDPLSQALQSLAIDFKGARFFRFPEIKKSRLCSLSESHAQVVGQCLVYHFDVVPTDMYRQIDELKEREITIMRYELVSLSRSAGMFAFHMRVLMKELSDYTVDNSLPFEILFQLQSLAYNSYLHPTGVLNLARELRSIFKARKLAKKKPISVDAMKKFLDTIDWPSPHGDPKDFETAQLVKTLEDIEDDIQNGLVYRKGLSDAPPNLARVHRAMVSPTRITLHGPELEPNNRILRKFPKHREYFLRVQFCDENGQDLHFNPKLNHEGVFVRFKDILKSGIQIAGRTYKFLGFSHSSLRSHSVWASIFFSIYSFSSPFFEGGAMQTYFTIIKALGNFSHITSPARCAARIGQAFSETPFALALKENSVTVVNIPDIKSADGSRVFSDGVGTISWDVVEKIWASLPRRKGSPTSFQIRMGGAKGMLALDPRLAGSVIQVRPSMVKFESDDMGNLEICDMASKPIPLVLNRQVIKIMEDMGVPEAWFSRLQSTEVRRLRQVTANTGNTAKFLKEQNTGDSIKLHKLFRLCEKLRLDYKMDAFLRSVVQAVILRELRLLKHKARIPVEKGMTLFGILDETGFLKENQVYVATDRYIQPPGPGKVLVTRSPALYDGDVQIAEHVVPPWNHPLRQHTSCIIFSRQGKRDLPSQLSGGDLDGDLYNVIWDQDAMPPQIQTFLPADYPRVEPLNIGRAVTVDDMAGFFVDFMKTDHLGVIAIRHMILADQNEEGTRHPDCKKLAELHSTAVDFSKTGIPVMMEHLPKANAYRPDFLAPGPQTRLYDKSEIALDPLVLPATYNEDEDDIAPPRKYYRSEKILGKLYRAIDEQRIWANDIRRQPMPYARPFWEEFLRDSMRRCLSLGPIIWSHRCEEARHIQSAYEDAIISAMNEYSDHPINPISELEVFIGFIINKTGVQTHRQRDRSIRLSEEFERISAWIVSQMRRSRGDTASVLSYSGEFDALELCLACVHVGVQQDQGTSFRRRRDVYGDIKSFKVVAACALLAELDDIEKEREGGGYIGVMSRVRG
ncbi:hypothetical protein ASPZODRAFT_164365 [Penicilliopsis zonata CBS 506.65]|uniref:RNA-dependent RNA polymerase n=1 Tax=Penicilliopsis zonata CBS 506.65 TaxID=1073090 RepID=A0A1L9ST76_9EURO|nr:hypothetical protein ASPZODRAFT_164365 [Penicilliopsis zonata CBS 506.65]OJJ50415.1 hypothetical protein ASPZODRAFT_164365 [Penicilliopsis zonata CBS 506.65]